MMCCSPERCAKVCSDQSLLPDRHSSTLAGIEPAHWLVKGSAKGNVLYSPEQLSFWGGVDMETGEIIDRHHPLSGQYLPGKVLAIPGSRGSCSGSLALLELLVARKGPTAILLEQSDEILALGSIIAHRLFQVGIPVVKLGEAAFQKIGTNCVVNLDNDRSQLTLHCDGLPKTITVTRILASPAVPLQLSDRDRDILSGRHGETLQEAMRVCTEMATLYGADRLVDVSRAHIDACIYTGPASLAFAKHFEQAGVHFNIPTTLNSISIDRGEWQHSGTDPSEAAQQARLLAEAYIAMGASEDSLTCAPYLLSSAPRIRDQIAWAESNAVVYANSVIGARTQKYPDLLDVCIAITGRAPYAGCHVPENRSPSLIITLSEDLRNVDDSAFWPLLGYHIGGLSGSKIPIVCGLEQQRPRPSQLKAFGAGFATTSNSQMFHILGITPEAANINAETLRLRIPERTVTPADLLPTWNVLNSAKTTSIELIALGNPHFTMDEFEELSFLLQGRRKNISVSVVITCSRAVQKAAENAGLLQNISAYGARIVNDTCWCMLRVSSFAKQIRNIATTSAKYAHYGPGLTGKGFHFRNLAECVDIASDADGLCLSTPGYLVPGR